MIHIDKDYDAPPPALTDAKWAKLRADALTLKFNTEAATRCYRETTIDALATLYHDKCAYCERARGRELQVDHYRSKKPRAFREKTEHNHPGYYWLWYTWSNLLPACSKCNLLKSTFFPVAGTRVTSHLDANGQEHDNAYSVTWLQQQEAPLLLNPEMDANFANHFLFLNNGLTSHRSARGDNTIWICQLNRRQLKLERLKILKDLAKAIEDSFDDYRADRSQAELAASLRTIFKSITKGTKPEHAFSLYYQYIYNYFPYFIGSHLPTGIRAAAISYFEAYKLNG